MSVKFVRAALALLTGLACVAISTSPAPANAADRVGVTIVAPLIAPADGTGLIDADALAQYTSPLGLLTRELDALIGRPVAIGIDPRIIVSIRVLGSAAPPTATAWLDRLASASNEIFPLSYADADLTLQFDAGAAAPLAPQSFDFAIDETLFSPPAETASPTPEPTSSPGTNPPPLPSTEDLLDWSYSNTTIAWPAEGTVSAGAIEWLAASGFEHTIVSSGNLEAAGSAVATAESSALLVSNDTVSALFREAAAATTAEAWGAATARLTAAIAAERAAGTSSIVVTLDRAIPHTGSRVAETIDAVSTLPTAAMVSLDRALQSSGADAAIADATHESDLVTAASTIITATDDEADFATILTDPRQLTAPRALHALALFSCEWRDNPAGWHTRVAAFSQESAELLSAVQVADISTINLLTNLKPLPISVDNDLPYAVTVYITVRPRTALLKVEDSRVELTIEPNSQGKGEIPVQAITNGTVLLDVSLSSATGVPIGDRAEVEINVQASWETPITVALAVLVVLFFGVGIVRTVLRRRKAARD